MELNDQYTVKIVELCLNHSVEPYQAYVEIFRCQSSNYILILLAYSFSTLKLPKFPIKLVFSIVVYEWLFLAS